jgi:hypothetical protein
MDTYTNSEDHLCGILEKVLATPNDVEAFVIFSDPRSSIVKLRAPCLDLSAAEMRQRITICLKKFIRVKLRLPQAKMRIFVYAGIMGVAAIRVDGNILYAHHFCGQTSGNSTWMREVTGSLIFDDLARNFTSILKSKLTLELHSIDEVDALRKKGGMRDM